MPNFSILLPPAEGKQPGGNPFAPDMFDYRTSNTFNYFHDLNTERRKLIGVLQETIRSGDVEMGKLLNLQGEALDQAVAVNQEIYNAPLMSALDRYSPGVMYKAMDFTGLPTGAQRRLLENGIIFSGLFGLLRPDDLIPNYRLRMDASLPGIGRVSRYWREHMSALLNRTLKGQFVWNLLPSMHQEAWSDEHPYDAMVTVRFEKEDKGTRHAVSHGTKPLRGQLVNFIVRETLEEVEPLREWTHPAGYLFDEEAYAYDETTKIHQIVFVKSA